MPFWVRHHASEPLKWINGKYANDKAKNKQNKPKTNKGITFL